MIVVMVIISGITVTITSVMITTTPAMTAVVLCGGFSGVDFRLTVVLKADGVSCIILGG